MSRYPDDKEYHLSVQQIRSWMSSFKSKTKKAGGAMSATIENRTAAVLQNRARDRILGGRDPADVRKATAEKEVESLNCSQLRDELIARCRHPVTVMCKCTTGLKPELQVKLHCARQS